MKRTLLICPSEQSAASLGELLKTEGFPKITVSYTAFNSKQIAESEKDGFDLICINAPLIDENGIELAKHFAETTNAGVVIIVPKKNADDVNGMLTKYGVLVISKPVDRRLFHRFLQFADGFRTRILNMERENGQLKEMVEDLKVINRAKLLLVTCLNMSEGQAHRYLEKQAMDLRLSRVEVAKQVIKTYQN